MKKIFFILYACVFVFHSWGQGTLKITSGANITTSGGAYLLLDNMHISNDGSFQQSAGNGFVKLTGAQDVNLSGSSATILNQLLMAKTGSSTLNLQSNLSIVSEVNFAGGLLNLNNNVLDLGSTGGFTGESETSRALTTSSGYIQATGILNNPSSVNLGNLGAMISSTVSLGNTVIRRGHAIQTGVTGSNNSISRFFDIIPMHNQNLKAMLRFFYFEAELNSIPEGTLHQYKSKDNINWDFVGADERDMVANYIEKKSINKFERWTLATATAPTITCPDNITINANQNGCKALVSFAANVAGIPAAIISYSIGNKAITSPYLFSRGTTTVTAIASNGILPNAECSFTVTVLCGQPSSFTQTKVPQKDFKEYSTGFNVRVYPNPSANNFTLNLNSNNAADKITMQVVDVYGRVIEARNNLNSGTTIQLGRNYQPGVYFMKIIQGKNQQELKLVKL